MEKALNKLELLQAVQSEQALWDELIKEVGSERIARPGVEGHWSVKDIVSHVAYWRSRGIERLEKGLADPDWRQQDDERSDDEINDEAYRADAAKSPGQVLAEWDTTYRRLLAAIEALPGDLSRWHPSPSGDDASWTLPYPLRQQISGGLEHLQEHRDAIRSWLDLQKVQLGNA